jgi:hypothetical protein
MSNDIVMFEMPDGTQVSNDPRWALENMRSAREEALNAFPDRGKIGATDAEIAAQIGNGQHPLQSGQDGNFEVDDLAVDGRMVNPDAARLAQSEGNTPNDPAVTREVPDSNEAVQAVRDEEEARMEAQVEAQNAAAEASSEGGSVAVEDMKGAQLKAELKRRQAERKAAGEEPLDTTGVKKTEQLRKLLQDDDASRS